MGFPGVPIEEKDRPEIRDGDKVYELEGHYVLPGFVDLHGHIGGVEQGTPAEYVLKLWMGHGITTVCDPMTSNGLGWVLDHKKKSAANEITAPRIEAYSGVRARSRKARVDARGGARLGERGCRDGRRRHQVLRRCGPTSWGLRIDEAGKHDLRTTCHHAQLNVSWLDALDSARLGLTSMQHWYGLPEALFDDRTVQDYPADYNYNNEQNRFEQAGRLWEQAAPQGSEHWNAVMNELLELDFTLSPTFVAYETTRDFMRMAPGGVARGVHACRRCGAYYEPNRTNACLLLVLLDERDRGRLEGELPAVDELRQRVQEPRRSRRRGLGLRLLLQPVRLLVRPRAGAASRGRLSSARGDPRCDAEGRGGARPRRYHRDGRGRQAGRLRRRR